MSGEEPDRGVDAHETTEAAADPVKRQTLKKLAALGLLASGGGISLSGLPGCSRLMSRSGPGTTRSLQREAAGANVVICLLDAARADHLGCYGYPRQTTPNVDRLAEESLVFERHFCQDDCTKASVASMFTGQYPDTHLAFGYRPIGKSTFTIAQGLRESGFHTALFSSNPWACPKTGNGLNFQDAYSPDDAAVVAEGDEKPHSPEPVLRLFRKWLDDHQRSQFFAYLHFIPPHRPYGEQEDMVALFEDQRPPDYDPAKYRPGVFDVPLGREIHDEVPPLPKWINLYDANLRYGDWAAGEVERLLREAGVFDNTIFIVTADHGEAFGEHGFVLHSPAIHDEVSRIPLIIRFPQGSPARRLGALTQSIDLPPTICELFKTSYPEDQMQGRSILPLISGNTEKIHDYVFTHGEMDRHKYMVRGLRYALLLYGMGMGKREWRMLYNLEDDPEQQHNVLDEHPDKEEELIEVFRAFAEQQRWPITYCIDPSAEYMDRPRGREEKMTPQIRRQLEALGYLK